MARVCGSGPGFVARGRGLLTFLTSTDLMDNLLLRCFLHALKSKVKKADLPLLTSTFLRNHMFSCW